MFNEKMLFQKNIQCKYLGFSISSDEQKQLLNILSILSQMAPQPASLKVTFSIYNEGYKVLLRMTTPKGPVFSVATGPTLEYVLNRASLQTMRKFKKCKSNQNQKEIEKKYFSTEVEG